MTSTRLRLPTRVQVRLPTSSTPTQRPSLPHRHHQPPQSRPFSYSPRSIPRPRITQSSIWTSLIPKFLRNRSPASAAPAPTSSTPKSKEWNPASFYIIIFILIGSQAIRMIALKNEYKAYTRSTDAKIRLLREVIEKVKAGEVVDVEKLLGKGDEGVEREWEEVLKEIEQEDSLWHRRRKEAEEKHEQDEGKAATATAKVVSKDLVVPAVDKSTPAGGDDGVKEATKRRVGFF
ncbi:hypothetical protein ASPCAL05361 [Aspergillus calidoustus]|uniref:Uncharacterized protein n=1 Tax=Aspergillus calidoustus TaxID=454130 RepID=A0A0U5FY22_ASPCI|nr:hypothetical protein ASPCAL05361 [Aspergillus calidoustus]